jgi:hypothetical protein
MSAWKDLERRVCRALGAQRRPSVGAGGWARGSDDDGTAYFATEVKRTTRLQLRAAWVEQARRNARATSRPWLLVIGTHGSPRLVAVLDFAALVRLGIEAGRLPAADNRGESMSSREQEPNPNESDAERIQREAREQAEQQQQQQQQQQQRGEEGED